MTTRSKKIDAEIEKLSQDEIDRLLASSRADRRCKVEIAILGSLVFLFMCLCIAHISFYIGEFNPPKLHKAFLFFMTTLVTPYAILGFYREAYASIVVRP